MTVHQKMLTAATICQNYPRGRSRDQKMTAKRKPHWTILEDNVSQQPPSYEFSYPVQHSFGRGSFRSVAEKVVIPKLVLDRIIGKQCWTEKTRTEKPRGHGCGTKKNAVQVGGAGSGANVGFKPKSSGRARALQLRAQTAAVAQKRPGRQVRLTVSSERQGDVPH